MSRHEDIQFDYIKHLIKAIEKGNDPFPLILEIHPSGVCNQRCSYCSWRFSYSDRLNLDDYYRLFEEMKVLGINRLSISGNGEPFMNPDTPNIILYALNNGLNIRLVTNATLLDSYEILYRLDEIRISLDSTEKNAYILTRGSTESQYNRALENLKNLCRNRKNGKPFIGVTFILTASNMDLTQSVRDVLNMGVDYVIIKYDIYNPVNLSHIFFDDPRVQVRNGNSTPIGRCFIPYFKIAINPKGDVFSCCLGAQPNETNGYKLGHYPTQTLSDIWRQSREMRYEAMKKIGCQFCNYTDNIINTIISKVL